MKPVRSLSPLLVLLAGLLAGCSTDDEGDGGAETPVASIEIIGPGTIASGGSAEYSVRLLGGDEEGIRGTPVSLSTSLGTLSLGSGATSAVTNANGELSFTLTGEDGDGERVEGSAELVATATVDDEAYSDTLNVSITPTVFAFTAPAEGTNVAVNARQTVKLRWTSDGINISAPVVFKTSKGVLIDSSGGIASQLTVTAVNGVASIDVLSSSSGAATLTATDEATQQLMASLALNFVGEPAKLTVTAPSPIRTGRTSLIEVIVLDSGGSPVEGIDVQFALTAAAGGSLSPGSATTSATGAAYSAYTAGSATGTATVEVTAEPLDAQTVTITVTN